MKKVGFLYTRLRVEEKLLLDELKRRSDVEIVLISDEDCFFAIHQSPRDVDVLFERSISYSRGLYISRIFSANGAGGQ
jgi:[lysine-biosynthesis-protein LysW]--L-2-aminoadipate ligase